ncbi:hypothetical protein ACHHYP_14397, partial [Achlya hypogyna]
QNWVDSACQLTLAEITARIANELNVSVSIPTVHRALDGRAYTYKDVHPEPLQMNTDLAKENRRHYVQRLRALAAQGKVPIWVDETNFNLFTARRKGRAKRNTRAVEPLNAPQKGKNLHVIGAMTSQGFHYMEHMRGAYRNERANAWLRRMLRKAIEFFGGSESLLVICDNAPCHTRYAVGFYAYTNTSL